MKQMNLKNNSGITMVALVVTIILLLILSGITIGTISGKDGLIAKAKQAKRSAEQASINEAMDINKLYDELNFNTGDSTSNSTTENTIENVTNTEELTALIKQIVDTEVSSKLAENNAQVEQKVKNDMYPVGSIYMSEKNTNPSEFIGGTWETYAQGRTLIGNGTNDGYTFTSGSTGTTIGASSNPLGEYIHLLTITEMPWHTHTTGIQSNLAYGAGPAGNETARVLYNQAAGLPTTGTGGSGAHNNIQPYIVTYMWKRTA